MKLEAETLPGDIEHIMLDGRLDIEGVQEIDVKFTAMTTTRKGLFVVDLARVTLLASIGIRLLVQAARGQQGRSGKLTIAGAQPAVKKALESAGIDKLIPIFDDVESARTAFA